MSGIELAMSGNEEATASANTDEVAAEGRELMSALPELLEVCVCVMERCKLSCATEM